MGLFKLDSIAERRRWPIGMVLAITALVTGGLSLAASVAHADDPTSPMPDFRGIDASIESGDGDGAVDPWNSQKAPAMFRLTFRVGPRVAGATTAAGISADSVLRNLSPQAAARFDSKLLNKLNFGFGERMGPELRIGAEAGVHGIYGTIEFVYAESKSRTLRGFEYDAGLIDGDEATPQLRNVRYGNTALRELGGALGLGWRFTQLRPFVPSVFLTAEGCWLDGDAINYGVTIYGRIGAAFEYFVADWFSLRAEFAYFAGAMGASTPMDLITNAGPRRITESPSFGFAHGGSFLFGIGIL